LTTRKPSADRYRRRNSQRAHFWRLRPMSKIGTSPSRMPSASPAIARILAAPTADWVS
jgi:hypothetical protein